MFKVLQQRIRQARQEEAGFTLIELLIVIVILGVLAGIVVFAVSAFNNDGKTAACKADQKNVEIASEAYYAQASPHLYPKSITDLTTGTKIYLKEQPSTANLATITFDNTGATAPAMAACP
jgi:prepilin-type N-terminal cleavage/methylation domain-containing protein